ncbi:hypothetical protein, partial [Alistipes putredinis]|uniref:hypothetical protein n=1 Tax=Alistipes putredinis TaxID=28117 RepID=UPI003AABC9FC
MAKESTEPFIPPIGKIRNIRAIPMPHAWNDHPAKPSKKAFSITCPLKTRNFRRKNEILSSAGSFTLQRDIKD